MEDPELRPFLLDLGVRLTKCTNAGAAWATQGGAELTNPLKETLQASRELGEANFSRSNV